jgi:hypothetical protein
VSVGWYTTGRSYVLSTIVLIAIKTSKQYTSNNV